MEESLLIKFITYIHIENTSDINKISYVDFHKIHASYSKQINDSQYINRIIYFSDLTVLKRSLKLSLSLGELNNNDIKKYILRIENIININHNRYIQREREKYINNNKKLELNDKVHFRGNLCTIIDISKKYLLLRCRNILYKNVDKNKVTIINNKFSENKNIEIPPEVKSIPTKKLLNMRYSGYYNHNVIISELNNREHVKSKIKTIDCKYE